jgi:hypothetical protein
MSSNEADSNELFETGCRRQAFQGAFSRRSSKTQIRGLTKKRNAILGSIEAYRNGEKGLLDDENR